MIKRLGLGLAALLFVFMLPAAPALAQGISQKVAPCNWSYPTRCAAYDASGALPVTMAAPPVGTSDVNLKQVNGQAVNVGAGAAGTGTQRVTTSTDSTIGTVTAVTTVATITNPVGVKGANGSAIASVSNPLPVGGNAASGAAVAGNPNLIAGASVDGNARTVCASTLGVLCAPQAGTAQRTITKTSVTATTSTTVCPAATNPVATEIQFQSGSIGVGLQGQALTAATYGTTTADPDLVITTAGTLYTLPVAASNVITVYGPAQIVVCIQTLRQ